MNIDMTVVYCANCHIPFAMTDDLIDRLRKSHNSFYCPMGHGNHYSAETEEEKLRKKLLDKTKQLNETELQLKSIKESLEKKASRRVKKVAAPKGKSKKVVKA